MKRFCSDCGGELIGRTDKKFCSDHCRSNYHNRLHADERRMLHLINSRLRKNRRILQTFASDGKSIISKEELTSRGFDINYFTQLIENEGMEIRCCYDMAIKNEKNGQYQLLNELQDNYSGK